VGEPVTSSIQTDPLAEAERTVAAARDAGVVLCGTGGVAIGLRCESARREPLARRYGDLDFVTTKRQREAVEGLFVELGYVPDEQFNALHGETRLFFNDEQNQREADVFVDAVRGCHELELSERLAHGELTLAPADLLLSKLQVRETNRKDYQDIYALLLDFDLSDDDRGISEQRLATVCGGDWGWWRTVTEVSSRSQQFAAEVLVEDAELERVTATLRRVGELLEAAPKSRRWKMRARVGERVRWYETPEEVEHDAS
jgi:hypothetical protein